MDLPRRHLLLGASALPLAALASPARAETTDLVLNCDTALAAPMARAAEAFRAAHGVRVNVFPTPPGLILPQIARHIQNDLVMTRASAIRQAVTEETIAADAPRGGIWRNRLVIATRAGLPALDWTTARFAVTDATPGSEIDGPAIAGAMRADAGHVLGVIDTDEVAFLLLRGEAEAGLLHQSDIQAHPGLAVLQPVPETLAPPVLYAIAVTKLSRRPDPAAFIAFLAAAEGATLLQAAGLERVS